ncbi:MAG: insulinase family protein [Proteobacteria bacterium]|nr:insulinase family protein [Pseudomonadota bacterium]
MFTLLLLLSQAHGLGLPGLELTRDATTVCLANGLRLGFVSQRDRPIVGVAMAHRAGAREDPAEHAGIAHLVEHLSFEVRDEEGTTRTERLDALGASHNAWTGHDTVTYLAVAPRRALRSLLQLEVERLQRPIDGLLERDFVSEREVVRQEIIESGGDVDEPMMPLVRGLAWDGAPVRVFGGGNAGRRGGHGTRGRGGLCRCLLRARAGGLGPDWRLLGREGLAAADERAA